MTTTHLRDFPLLSITLLAALVGCGSTENPMLTSGGAVGGGGGGHAVGSGGAGGGAPVTWPKPCADIYDETILQTFELTFTPEERSALQTDCGNGVQQYRPVKFTYGGKTVDAMVRLKGNWSWDCNKMQFVVSFNQLDSKARFHGLRKLVLDAPWYDRTLLHERVAMPFFAERGLPYSCVNHARVVIDGEYYGLFANVERLDKEYLQRHFEEADGNLYQAGSELETNESLGDTSDLQALDATTTVADLATRMDLNEAVAEWATEAMLPAMDNFWAGVEINYYLYNHPSRGFLYLPYDMDIVFGDSAYPDGALIWPDSAVSDPIKYEHPGWLKEDRMKMVLSDPVWCQRFVDELVLARAAFSPTALSARVDAWNAQITEALAEDGRKPFTMADHEAAIVSMKAFFQTRAAFVDQWLAQGNHCPAVF
jgi:hypothetical protein